MQLGEPEVIGVEHDDAAAREQARPTTGWRVGTTTALPLLRASVRGDEKSEGRPCCRHCKWGQSHFHHRAVPPRDWQRWFPNRLWRRAGYQASASAARRSAVKGDLADCDGWGGDGDALLLPANLAVMDESLIDFGEEAGEGVILSDRFHLLRKAAPNGEKWEKERNISSTLIKQGQGWKFFERGLKLFN